MQANQNPLLDVARQTYKENLEDILELAETYKSECKSCSISMLKVLTVNLATPAQYDLNFNLKLSSSSGYYLEVKSDDVAPVDFPSDVFLNLIKSKNGHCYTTTTLELVSPKDESFYLTTDVACLSQKKLNQRLKSSFEEVLILSDSIIEDLRTAIVEDIACVYKASEAIAILDLVVLFSEHASTYNYVRPEFCSSMVIKAGRHPILDRSKAIPNDVYVSDSSRFTIITGREYDTIGLQGVPADS